MKPIKKVNKLSNKLKQFPFFYRINATVKATSCKYRYSSLCRYYKKIADQKGITYNETDVPKQVAAFLKERNINPTPAPKGKLRMLYVGTDPMQDWGGIIQGLQKFGEVVLFQHKPGTYGQLHPDIAKNTGEFNGNRLLEIIKTTLDSGPLHVVIGQMWAFSMNPIALQKVRSMGIPVVNISMDDRHAFRGKRTNGKWSGTSGLIGSIDLACTAAKECCLWYQVEGCPAIYLPEASDPQLYKPLPDPKLYDVTFVGCNYGIRTNIIKAIGKRGINTVCYGSGWPNGKINVDKLPQLFARSRIVLGAATIGHCTDFYSLKMRDFDGPMSGSLYLTHNNPDLYDLFDVGKEIVTYRTPEECAEKVAYYLNHPNEAGAIGAAGKRRAEKDHTWEKRFEKILKALGVLQE